MKQRIIIVGGGTAGWLSALYLSKKLPQSDYEVTILLPKDNQPIGVGESTVVKFKEIIDELGINESELLMRTNGTYKLGIYFEDWLSKDSNYWHPFGGINDMMDSDSACQGALGEVFKKQNPYAYADLLSFTPFIAKNRCIPIAKNQNDLLGANLEYAYHLDAGLLGEYIKEKSIESGVQVIYDTVCEVEMNNGIITKLVGKSGMNYMADTFIDCSGFAEILISKYDDNPWISYTEELPCDTALAIQYKRKDSEKIRPYTTSTALSAGWCWQIDLSNRTGAGYVFSSKYIGVDQAREEIISSLDITPEQIIASRVVPMKIGRRKYGSPGNCTAVGLSYGFLEPLEATGIYFIHQTLQHVVAQCFDKTIDVSNKMAIMFDEVKDFIALHYLLSNRQDSIFWKDIGKLKQSISVANLMDSYKNTGSISTHDDVLFKNFSYYYILTGMGQLPEKIISPIGLSSEYIIKNNTLKLNLLANLKKI